MIILLTIGEQIDMAFSAAIPEVTNVKELLNSIVYFLFTKLFHKSIFFTGKNVFFLY